MHGSIAPAPVPLAPSPAPPASPASLPPVVVLAAPAALLGLLPGRGIERICEPKEVEPRLTIYNSRLVPSLRVCSRAKSLRCVSSGGWPRHQVLSLLCSEASLWAGSYRRHRASSRSSRPLRRRHGGGLSHRRQHPPFGGSLPRVAW